MYKFKLYHVHSCVPYKTVQGSSFFIQNFSASERTNYVQICVSNLMYVKSTVNIKIYGDDQRQVLDDRRERYIKKGKREKKEHGHKQM